MNHLKIGLITIVLIFFTANILAQSENKDVTITSSGSGNTLEEAKQSALRSATEQAFGTFISSKTEIFNDQVVADQMASVSSGNIKSYEILNQAQLPDGRWGVTLNAIVSVDKLTSFVQSKGYTVEIQGGMFAINIKQQILNEEGEINAISEMIGLLHETMQISFDYDIKNGDPKSLDSESKNWSIPLTVTARPNKNLDFCANYINNTLKAITLSFSEIETYNSLNKQIFPLEISYNGKLNRYYLRRQYSISAIHSLASNWNLYTRLFKVEIGTARPAFNRTYLFELGKGNQWEGIYQLNFPASGEIAGTFSGNFETTLQTIQTLDGFSVKPFGVISPFRNGGYVVYEKNGHGLVMSLFDLGHLNWDDANTDCEKLVLNGYSDWHLPSREELELINSSLGRIGEFGLSVHGHWSSTQSAMGGMIPCYLRDNSNKETPCFLGSALGKHVKKFVRAVRVY